MKKLLIIFLVITLASLTACGTAKEFKDGTACEEILNAVVEATEHPDSDKLYLKSEDNLDSSSFSLWVDGLYQESDELDLFSDYAIFVSAGTTTYEIAVLKASENGSTDKLISVFERRKETLTLGDKGMYDPKFDMRISSSKIEVAGDIVILLITDDNDAALKALENLK
ncbi:MAG: hypothetical protein IIX54_02885 [Clostridia bacterium]|nr:hypothetical protein [Clostridia bacterium]